MKIEGFREIPIVDISFDDLEKSKNLTFGC